MSRLKEILGDGHTRGTSDTYGKTEAKNPSEPVKLKLRFPRLRERGLLVL